MKAGVTDWLYWATPARPFECLRVSGMPRPLGMDSGSGAGMAGGREVVSLSGDDYDRLATRGRPPLDPSSASG